MTDAREQGPKGVGRALGGGVAIITGASRGIGAATARAFAGAGAAVVLAARDAAALSQRCAEIVAAGGVALAVPADVGDPESVRRLVERTLPGPIVTERIAALPEQAREQIGAAVPMRRAGDPREVAAAVVWLCSDAASFITGSTLLVDGGRLAGVA